jgi:hypothetical protein
MRTDPIQPAPPANAPEVSNPPTRTLVFKTRFHRKRRREKIALEEGPPPPLREPTRRPARIAITLALGHKIEQAILEGKLKDRADAARRLGLSRARISQICDLTLVPVEDQERILFLEAVDGREPVTVRTA